MLLILNYLIISVSLQFIFHLFCEALAMLKTKYRVLLLLVFVAYLYKFVVGIAVKNSLNVIALFNFQLLLCSYVWFLQLFKDQPIMSEHYKNDQIVETFIEWEVPIFLFRQDLNLVVTGELFFDIKLFERESDDFWYFSGQKISTHLVGCAKSLSSWLLVTCVDIVLRIRAI